MLEHTASLRDAGSVRADAAAVPTGGLDPAVLDAQWRRCRREAQSLTMLELALMVLAVVVLVVVALCGIVAITHTAVASGALALPLGLGLAVTIALALLGLAFRVRISHEISSHELFRLDCARHSARERAKLGDSPYRVSLPWGASVCTRCLFEEAPARSPAGR